GAWNADIVDCAIKAGIDDDEVTLVFDGAQSSNFLLTRKVPDAGPDGFVAEIGLLALAQVGAHQECGRHRHRSGSFDKFHSHVKEGVRTSGYF
ncbi:MAG: hypothetical protein VX002_03060, partial [Bacteroidota bacterium]|nr:hypothetical protein [Bacteroidota bacterium]